MPQNLNILKMEKIIPLKNQRKTKLPKKDKINPLKNLPNKLLKNYKNPLKNLPKKDKINPLKKVPPKNLPKKKNPRKNLRINLLKINKLKIHKKRTIKLQRKIRDRNRNPKIWMWFPKRNKRKIFP